MTLPRLCPLSPRKVLAGGRAPSCWKRQVRRTTAGPAALARACAWVAELAHQPGPKLRREPLLGHCLPELVGALGQEEPSSPAEAETRRAKSPALREGVGDATKSGHGPSTEARRPRPARVDLPTDHKSTHRPAATSVAGGPKRATPELLARLGGRARGQGRLPTDDRRPDRRPPAADRHPIHRPPAADRHPIHWPPTADHRPPVGDRPGHDWSGRLIERVRQRALLPSPWEGLGEDAARLPSLPAPDERPADLTAQWGGSLEGRRVPAGWLAARPRRTGRGWVENPAAGPNDRGGRGATPSPNPSQREGGAALRPTTTGVGGPTVPSGSPARAGRRALGLHSLLRPRRAADSLLRGTRTGSDAGHAPFASEAADAEQWAGPDEGGAVQRNGRLEADDGEIVSVVSRFAPPRMADTLPPLRPPAGPGMTAMPAAAAAARRSARREEDTAVDDLDELAGKLRRILEEESRRHGIDI